MLLLPDIYNPFRGIMSSLPCVCVAFMCVFVNANVPLIMGIRHHHDLVLTLRKYSVCLKNYLEKDNRFSVVLMVRFGASVAITLISSINT